MKVFLKVDVEDVVHPESDDCISAIAESLESIGVPGSFFITGDKARLLEKRNRNDVIDALKLHDIAYHSNYHSMHPTISEYLAHKNWLEGIHLSRQQEFPGIEDLERIFKRKIRVFGEPGGTVAPQLIAACGMAGLAYSSFYGGLKNYAPLWYCGALCFPSEQGEFEEAYPNLSKLRRALAQVIEKLEFLERNGAQCSGVFLCHPTRLLFNDFWDELNFAYGRNTPAPYNISKKRATTLKIARKRFTWIVESLARYDWIDITTASEIIDEFNYQPKRIPTDTIIDWCHRCQENGELLIEGRFSLAELVAGICDEIVSFQKEEKFPSSVRRISCLGPLEVNFEHSLTKTIPSDSLIAMCKQVLLEIANSGILPSYVIFRNKKSSLIHFLTGCIKYLIQNIDKPQRGIAMRTCRPGMPTLQQVEKRIFADCLRRIKGWAVHKPDLDYNSLCTLSKLQAWSIKLAYPTERKHKLEGKNGGADFEIS